METFGKRLKKARLSKEITQVGLCEICGLHRNSIYQYEKEIIKPTIEKVALLCIALNVTSDYLIGLQQYKDEREGNDASTIRLELGE
jgi:transcriptional regulator with XRE-family HTH domain